MKINLEQLLFWDIETAPKESFSEDHLMFDTWLNRNRKEKLTSEELIEKFNKEGGLYSEYLNIVCISCAFIHENQIRINSFTGNEKSIVDGFLKVAEFVKNRSGKVISVGHNIGNFDVPVVRKIYSRYYPMFTYPDYISDLNTSGALPIPEKPWLLAERMLDTLQLQKGTNYMFSSMAETALNLGLPSPKLDTDGSMVTELVRNGEIKRVSDYCEGDVITSLKILFNWMGQDMLPIAEKVEQVETKEIPVLLKIYNSKNFAAHKEELKQQLLERGYNKKTPKAEKETVKELVLAHYLERTAFDDMDKKAKEVINKTRIEEVNEFFKSL